LIEICFLGSGSSGNCAAIRSGTTTVLLDAGLSMRETKKRLAAAGGAIADVRAVLLTHEHSDHVRGAGTLLEKLGVPVYASEGTARAARLPGPLFGDVRRAEAGRDLVIGDLHVRVTRTPHDGTESVCYVFADGGGRRIGVATDLGHLSPGVCEALANCEVLGLEANHDVDMLRDGPYPLVLKRRILSEVGHLSNDDAADGLARLVGARTGAVVALHVSRHNNTPALAGRAFAEALAALGARVTLDVAAHDRPTMWRSVGATSLVESELGGAA
jgi:phosphoribosyl 1,2-cyclic phosphodiesterase